MKKKPTNTKNANKTTPLPSRQWLSQSTRIGAGAATPRANLSDGSGFAPTVDIIFRGNVVTGQTVDVDAGEAILLVFKVQPGGLSVGATNWIIPGKKVVDFTANNYIGKVTPFVVTQLSAPIVNFIWVDRGSHPIRLIVEVIKGEERVSVSAQATFRVKKPEYTFDGRQTPTAKTQVSIDSLVKAEFQTIVRLDRRGEGADGKTCWAQVVNQSIRNNDANGQQSTLSQQGIDQAFPYPGTPETEFSDQPSMNHLNPPTTAFSAHDEFTTWLMWQSPKNGAIWVPIQKADWRWWFSTSFFPEESLWTINAADPGGFIDPSHTGRWRLIFGADTTVFPEWMSRAINQ